MDAFEKWQRMRRWEARCDPSCAFESKFAIDGLTAWRLQAGMRPAPARSEMTARVLKSCIGHVAIFEREADGRWLIRLMGTRLTSVLGEMQGKHVDEAVAGRAGRRWKAALDATLHGMKPLRFVSHVAFRDLDYLVAEVLLAPLLDEAGDPTMAFCIIAFRAGVGQPR